MAWKDVQYENGKYRTSEGGGGGGSSTFAGLEDVSFNNLQNGQVPKYNSATQKWENADESGGGGTVTDVKVDGQSVVDPQTGEANITMPTPPMIPVVDVEVNGVSVVDGNKKAQVKSYKEVTQAEYNALPDSKLNDGILYAIKDVGGSDGFPPLIYSDEEREVGVWRDGKPLYQKTIVKNNIAIVPPNGYIAHEIQNVDMIIRLNVLTFNANSPTSYTSESGGLSFTGGSSTKIMNGFRADRTNIMFIGTSGPGDWSADVNRYWYFTFYYTKTTDTPGSGTWTTQGALAHHYSTDEHIIGTWIDGKPLYEKTINIGHSASTDYDVRNLNIKTTVQCLGSIEGFGSIPFVTPLTNYSITCVYGGGYIQMRIGSALSVSNDCYVALRYTKTTD